MNRVVIYFGVWAALVVAALILRFTVLVGIPGEARFLLAIAVMLVTFAILAGTNVYESRRVALLAGLHGRGTFGYLRGWLKTAYVELAVHDSQLPREAERQFRAFRIASLYATASLIIVEPLILF